MASSGKRWPGGIRQLTALNLKQKRMLRPLLIPPTRFHVPIKKNLAKQVLLQRLHCKTCGAREDAGLQQASKTQFQRNDQLQILFFCVCQI